MGKAAKRNVWADPVTAKARIAELEVEKRAAEAEAGKQICLNTELEAEVERLEAENDAWAEKWLTERTENAKLREALGHIADMRASEHRKVAIAREALLEGKQ